MSICSVTTRKGAQDHAWKRRRIHRVEQPMKPLQSRSLGIFSRTVFQRLVDVNIIATRPPASPFCTVQSVLYSRGS